MSGARVVTVDGATQIRTGLSQGSIVPIGVTASRTRVMRSWMRRDSMPAAWSSISAAVWAAASGIVVIV
jgi:hypothetical protein